MELSLRLILLSSALIFAKWKGKEYRFVNEESFHQMGYIEGGLLLQGTVLGSGGGDADSGVWDSNVTPTPVLEEFLI